MGVSKVDLFGETIVDLTSDTVAENNLLQGTIAHNSAGEEIEGTVVVPTKVSQLENDVGYAPTENPVFTGTPKAPTPPDNENSTQIATTAYVKKLIANLVNGAPETLDTLKEIADALGENDDAVQALNAAIGNKVDKVVGKGLSTNDFTTAEKNKLAGIANNANNYSLPLASAAVRGGVKVGYTENGKNYPVELSNEQMFVKVPWTDNDTWKANTTSSEGYVAAGSGHANQVWKTDANGVPGWREDANTTYGAATQSSNGLMPAEDKKKLDGIPEGGNSIPLTTSLAVTQAGVSALDGTVGKVLNDKGTRMSVYVGSDEKLHFRNWNGADSVLNFNKLYKEFVCGSTYYRTSEILYKSNGDVQTTMGDKLNASGNYIKLSHSSNGLAVITALQVCTMDYIQYGSTKILSKSFSSGQSMNVSDGPFFFGVK